LNTLRKLLLVLQAKMNSSLLAALIVLYEQSRIPWAGQLFRLNKSWMHTPLIS